MLSLIYLVCANVSIFELAKGFIDTILLVQDYGFYQILFDLLNGDVQCLALSIFLERANDRFCYFFL